VKPVSCELAKLGQLGTSSDNLVKANGSWFYSCTVRGFWVVLIQKNFALRANRKNFNPAEGC